VQVVSVETAQTCILV